MAKSIIGRRVFYASSSICDNNSEMEHVASISKERQLRLTTEYALTQYVLRRVIHKLHSFITTFASFSGLFTYCVDFNFLCLFITKVIY